MKNLAPTVLKVILFLLGTVIMLGLTLVLAVATTLFFGSILAALIHQQPIDSKIFVLEFVVMVSLGCLLYKINNSR